MTALPIETWRTTRSIYDLPPPSARPRAVYVHVPFCLHRCGYCDFTLVADRDDLVDDYLTALSGELSELSDRCPVDSIYVGGGTPTHLTAAQLEQLLQRIDEVFPLEQGGEYSMEANPDGLSEDRLEVLRSAGVNRISLGVQSFDAAVLKTLERTHSPQEAQDVVARTQEYIPNVSLDLIFGVPGQSIESWQQTLTTALDLPIRHVSTYGLTFEKGTSFYRRRAQNELHAVSSDVERRQYAMAMDLLNSAGLRQYEISNFARPGAACRHNHVYWDADEYFAFGPGAARYVNGIRSTNSRNVSRWIQSWLQRTPLLQDYEQLSAEDRAREAVLLGLRRNQGIAETRFLRRFGVSISSLSEHALRKHLTDGLLERVEQSDDGHTSETWLRLTDEGRFLTDSVVVDFL